MLSMSAVYFCSGPSGCGTQFEVSISEVGPGGWKQDPGHFLERTECPICTSTAWKTFSQVRSSKLRKNQAVGGRGYESDDVVPKKSRRKKAGVK